MAVLASAIIAESLVLLNDTGEGLYKTSNLLPILRKAYVGFQLELAARGALELKEISANITVPALTEVLNGVGGFPVDFIEPIALGQRDPGSTSPFTPIDKDRLDPYVQSPNNYIQGWAWREGEVKIGRASSIREVRLLYKKGF